MTNTILGALLISRREPRVRFSAQNTIPDEFPAGNGETGMGAFRAEDEPPPATTDALRRSDIRIDD